MPAADTVMLSETTDGDYIISRFIVKRLNDTDYSIRYQINLSRLSASFDGNSRKLDALDNFVNELMTDTLMKVKAVHITGYASPDGPMSFNQTLAKNRTKDFKNYVDKKYGFSKKYDVTTSSVAEDWDACRTLVAQSDIPDKQAVLRILDDSRSHEAKEAQLKKMPAVWDYMAKNILPPLRRVVLSIDYAQGNVVEQRTMIPKPQPEPEPTPECVVVCPCEVIDDTVSGIIIQLPEPGSEYDRQEAREETREARREARRIERIARQDARAAKKIARKEAKAARKAEKAAAKTYKELENL